MFAYSMATRRTKRRQTKRTRKGSGRFTQFLRNKTGREIAPSTSLLATEIHAMLNEYGIEESNKDIFDPLMRHNKDVNKVTLIRDLLDKKITPLQHADILTNLKRVIPRSRFLESDFHSSMYAAAEIYPLLDDRGVQEDQIGKLFTILRKYDGINMERVYTDLKTIGANSTQIAHIRVLL